MHTNVRDGAVYVIEYIFMNIYCYRPNPNMLCVCDFHKYAVYIHSCFVSDIEYHMNSWHWDRDQNISVKYHSYSGIKIADAA